jgi:hypothetical protein
MTDEPLIADVARRTDALESDLRDLRAQQVEMLARLDYLEGRTAQAQSAGQAGQELEGLTAGQIDALIRSTIASGAAAVGELVDSAEPGSPLMFALMLEATRHEIVAAAVGRRMDG